jgi:hypothetical protein
VSIAVLKLQDGNIFHQDVFAEFDILRYTTVNRTENNVLMIQAEPPALDAREWRNGRRRCR